LSVLDARQAEDRAKAKGARVSERNDDQDEIRVTDKRMFTSTGELREEFRELGTRSEEAGETSAPQEAAAQPEPASAPEQPEQPAAPAGSSEATRKPVDLPPTAESIGQPSFLDLLATLAEPVAIYLGDVELPDGKSAEDLRLARFYIDLLTVLRDKTKGNLSSQEHKVLEDLMYRLQMRYVQKRG
jgi:hypothetical protein